MDNLLLGKNIKAKRKQLNLTLVALSERTGVSQSFLSQIEQNKVAPSLQTLSKIAIALQTTITSLLQTRAEGRKGSMSKCNEREVVEDKRQKLSFEILSKPNNDRMMQTFLFSFHGKLKGKPSKYQHFGQEFIYVLEGKIKITLESDEYILEEGDTLYYNSGIVHTIENYIDDTSKFIAVNTPPSF